MASLAERAPELEKYELLEEIGHGGMASVYRARDRRLGREVAVKLIHPHLRQNVEVASRFISEARAVAKLRHPNIVEVYDISDTTESERYLVVELIRGVTLRQILKEHGSLPVEVAVGIALEVAAALEHAHAEGVIHRDIKPENVLVELQHAVGEGAANVRVKLTDFGIAKLLDAQGITSTGQVLGSPAHMAPEQIEGASVDARADVFGLGVLLYECLVGHLPFDGKNPAQVLRAVLDGTCAPAEKERPEVGSRYGRLVAHSLARDAEQRFESVAAFARALREELAALQFSSALDEVVEFLQGPAGYAAAYVDRIVPRLVHAGEHARGRRQIAAATAHFNRALAYRPGDAQLLSRVSGLHRRGRMVKLASGLALGAALVAIGTLVVPQIVAWINSANVRPSARVRDTSAAAQGRGSQAADSPVAPSASPLQQVSQLRKVLPRLGIKPAQKKAEPRKVAVRITGAMGGSLKVDGQPREWFGMQQDLEPGEHLFEFVPPDETCCVPQSQVVLIKEGEGVQQVVGHLAFRDSVLLAGSQVEAEIRCPTLFAGALYAPGERTIPMGSASVTGSCTVSSRSEGSAPVTKIVTLRAGQTTELPWP